MTQMTTTATRQFLAAHAEEMIPLHDFVGVMVLLRGQETLISAPAGSDVYVLVRLSKGADVPLVGQQQEGA